MANNEGSWTRITTDERGRYCVWYAGPRNTQAVKRYADYGTALAVAERLRENGSPRRGFTA